jgi:hypothetical protein
MVEYTVRFRVKIEYLTEEEEQEKAILLEKMSVYEDKLVSLMPEQVFQEDNEYIWFQQNLNFLPQIGMEFPDIFDQLEWWRADDIPIVAHIAYYFKYSVFVVDLDYGRNYLATIRRIAARQIQSL